MTQLLTFLLSRAVPEVYVASVEVKRWSPKEGYFIYVEPHHVDFWGYFRIKYPHYRHLALKHGAERFTLGHCCPKFPTQEDLLGWVMDVLNLTQGERDFLRLYKGVK